MAVTLTLNQLAVQLRITDGLHDVPEYYMSILTDLLEAGTLLVEARAPDVPTDSQNMGVARICAYWHRGPASVASSFWLQRLATLRRGPAPSTIHRPPS